MPPERIYYQSHTDANTATVIFVRDIGMLGAGVYKHLSINGDEAASLNPGEQVSFKLRPDEYVFSVIVTDPFGATSPTAIDQQIVTGKTYQYRFLSDVNGGKIQRVISSKAQSAQ